MVLGGGVALGAETDAEEDGNGAVLLYDGECGLCNEVVRFLLRKGVDERLMFATLQGAYGQSALVRLGLPTIDYDSLVFLPSGREDPPRLRTDGVVEVLLLLPGGWPRMGRLLKRIPRSWRDFGYRLVAKSRYAWFGEYRPGPLPDAAWATRFID